MRTTRVSFAGILGLFGALGLFLTLGVGCGPGGGGGGGGNGGDGDDAGGMQDTDMNGECDNPTTYYEDSDGDGYGNPDASQMACSQPSGFVRKQGDCDDSDPAVNPDGTEKCDGKDNDCNGMTDDGLTKQCSKQNGVCSGASASCENGMFPTCGANEYGSKYEMGDETSCDNQDNDCDGNIDEGVSMDCPLQKGVCSGATVECSTGSFGSCDASTYGSDYEEKEMSKDGKDNDCDGLTDNAVEVHQFGGTSFDLANAVDYLPSEKAIFVAYRESGGGELARYDVTFNRTWDDSTQTDGVPGGVAAYSNGVITGGRYDGVSPEELDLERHKLDGTGVWDQNITVQMHSATTEDVAVNPNNGDVYMVGHTEGDLGGFETNSGGNDILLAKFPEDGSSANWNKLEGGSEDDFAQEVAIDPNSGDIFVAGRTQSDFGSATNPSMSASDYSPFLMRYSASGSLKWVKIFGPNDDARAYGVAYDSNNSAVYVSGRTEGAMGSESHLGGDDDGFVAKYDTSGSRSWVRLFGTGDDDDNFSVDVDESSGEVYLAGYTDGDLGGVTNAGSLDVALVKYDSSGSQQWTRLMGTSSSDLASDIAVDPETADIYVVGRTSGTWDSSCSGCGGTDAFLLREKD